MEDTRKKRSRCPGGKALAQLWGFWEPESGGGCLTTGGTSSLTINGTQISASGGSNWNGGTGSGGDINTNGGSSSNFGGGGAGGPYANGGSTSNASGGGFGTGATVNNSSQGQYGGYAYGLNPGQPMNPLGLQNNFWWDPRDIIGNGGTSYSLPGLGGGAASGAQYGSFGGGAGGGGIGGIGGGGGFGGNGGNGIVIIYW